MSYDPVQYWPTRYREQGDTYVARGGRPDSYRAEHDAIAPYLRALVVGPRVLDFGCGVGRFRAVLEQDREYVGVDLIPGLGTEPLGPTLPRGFATAVAIMVLQHVVDPTEYEHWVRELHACLEPGGRLVVVDHLPLARPAPHMAPRGPVQLQTSAPWVRVTDHGIWSSHWIGCFER